MVVSVEERRRSTRRRILDSAWELSRVRGLTGWNLRELGAAVGMRAPSLYGYFASKNDIYDALYADGYEQLLAGFADVFEMKGPQAKRIEAGSRRFVELAVADPARMQLLFLPVVPSFRPSEQSYGLAQRLLGQLGAVLAEVGVVDDAALDLWTATLTGLATQQVSNDPGGTRWLGLVDRAVAMLLTETT